MINVTDPGVWVVTKGIEGFVYSISDSMTGGNASATPSLLFNMVTTSVDPFQYSFVQEWWGIFLVLYAVLFATMIFAGGAWILMHRYTPDLVQRLVWQATGQYSDNFKLHDWIVTLFTGLILPALAPFGIYVILKLNYALSMLFADRALSNVPIAPDSLMIYFTMAFSYFLFSIIFEIRNIIIVLVTAGGLALAGLYLIEPLRELIKHVFMYVLLLIFMQPILIFVSAVGLMFLSAIPSPLRMMMPSLYTALIVIELGIALVIMVGYHRIAQMIGFTVRAVA